MKRKESVLMNRADGKSEMLEEGVVLYSKRV